MSAATIAAGWLAPPKPRRRPAAPIPVDPYAVAIGGEIRRRRRRRGLSIAGLAGRVGVHRSAISRWETGVRWPSVLQLLAVARALGCEAADLLPPRRGA